MPEPLTAAAWRGRTVSPTQVPPSARPSSPAPSSLIDTSIAPYPTQARVAARTAAPTPDHRAVDALFRDGFEVLFPETRSLKVRKARTGVLIDLFDSID
jgi:hypothetical protein